MSTIVPINIPCITKYKIGLDPDSGQLYYTSGITDYKSITIDPAVITGTIIEQLSDYIPISGLITTNDSISLINNELSLDRIVFNSYQDYSNITIGNEHSYTKYQKGGIYSRNDETQFSISSYFDEEINSNILDIQISGMGDDSFIRFNNNDQNTPNGLVVLDENGKIPTEIYNGIITNDTNLIGNGTEEQPLQLKYGKGIVSNNGISINPNDLIFDNDFTIGIPQINIGFTGGELQLNGLFLNEANSLVKLDSNGYIIDDCLLKLIEIDISDQTYQISGGTYTIFNNPISSLNLRTEYEMDNYPNFNKYGYIRFICNSEDINIEFPIQAKIIGTIPIFELNKMYLIKYLRNEFEISQITKLQLSNDYIVLPGITLTIDAGEIFNNITVSNQGTLIVNIPSIEKEVKQGSLKDLNIQSGGKLIYNIPEQYNPEKYTLLQGSNTSIASNTIYTLNGEICEGYCENGTFYNLNNTYVLGVGKGITVINPNISNSLTKLYGFNQAIINGAEIFDDGNLYIYNNCIASNTNINFNGIIYINNGGIAYNTNIRNDGNMNIYNGGIASETTINTMGSMTIYNGGIASETTINDYGHMNINNGGIASETNINSYGNMNINNGGIAYNTNIRNDGNMNIYNGGIASQTNISEYGNMNISSGGIASQTNISSGYMNVYGGIASNTNINSYGSMHILSGGIASNTNISENGHVYISSGGIANNTNINKYGSMYISREGIANSNTVNSGGHMSISSGGIANNNTINSSGYINISNGGIANNTILFSGGYINSFTFNEDKIFENIEDGIVNISNNVYILNHSMYINSGGTVSSVKTGGLGIIYVNNGGTIIDPVIDHWGGVRGNLIINSGGTGLINNTSNNGILNIFGGTATLTNGYFNKVNINSSGSMTISSGGIASETNIISGRMYISSGGIASNTNMSGGYMYIFSDGNAINNSINNGSLTINSGGIATNNIINDGYLIINDNGRCFINEINRAGYVSLKGHGIAISNTINSGDIYISNNCVASSNTVNSKGYITIYSGGMASETVINSGGYIIVYRNGILDTTTINSGGKLYISSGGICNNINVSDGGYINSFGFITDSYLHIDSTINDNIIIGNNVSIINYSMCINNSGIINSVNVYSRGQIFVNSGGTLIDPTFIYDGNSNGELNISSGGSVTIHTNVDAIINQYGGIVQLTDGYIKSANIISSGAVINISGGSINTLNINDYGINPIITSGGSIDTVNIDKWSTSSGTVGMRNNIYLTGGTINKLNNFGRMYLHGGIVNNLYMSGDTTNLNSITIYNGAIINGGSTAKTNTFIISSGGTVTINNFNFNSSSYIFASSGLFSNCNFTRNNLNIRGNVIISNCNITDNTKVYVNRGSVDNLIINSGCSIVVSAGTANYLNIGPSALLQVNSGGTALHIKLDSNALTPIIATGAVVSYD